MRGRSSFRKLLGRWLVLLLVASSLAAGCDSKPSREGTSSPSASPRIVAASNPKTSLRPTPEGLAQVRFDLAAHRARAEIRRGSALVIPLGESGGAKYTLGGFQTGVTAERRIDGIEAATLTGAVGRFLFSGGTAENADLEIRARSFGDGRATIYLNDRTVAEATFARGEFSSVRIGLEPGLLRPDENVLQLRGSGAGALPGGGRASLAVTSIAVGAREDLDAAKEGMGVRFESSAETPSVTIEKEWSVGWAFEVPPGARLRGIVRGTAEARLAIHLARDGGGAGTALASIAPSGDGSFDVDLAKHAGEVVRIDLRAEGGPISVVAPAVVTFESEVAPSVAEKPTNVIVFLVDTLRADKLRAYNSSTRVRTPGFDRFAESAALFERGLTQENWTKPSVATLLSSLYPWSHQTTTGDAVLPRSVRILPEMLSEKGFHTGAFICNGYVSDKFGFHRGWSTYRNYIREGRRTQASFVAADVLAWLDARPSEKPFFLYVHTIDPHVPYIPPDDLLAEYDPDPYSGPVDFTRDRTLLENIKIGRLRLGDRDKRRLEALYDGEVTYHDVHFAAILEGLRRRGLAENTLVVVTADHGEEFFEHGSVGHGHNVYQELLHVPLAMRVPGLTERGLRIADAAGLVDVVPTVLEALGLPIPAEAEGRSLLGMIRRTPDRAPRVVVSGFMQGWRTAVVGRFKLIQRTWAHPMLFDLATDPKEQKDLAADRPLTLRYLRALLGLALRGEEGPSRVVHRAQTTSIDAETEAQLRALGYVGTSRP